MSLSPEEIHNLEAGPNLEVYPIRSLDTPQGLATFFNEPNFSRNVLPLLGIVPQRTDYETASIAKRQQLATDQAELDSYAYLTLDRAYEDDKNFEAQRRDRLTGLLNREAWLDQIQLSINRATLTGGGLAIILLDLDGFKNANDALGHKIGDNILVGVGGRLVGDVRDGNRLSARLGGDEFGTVLEYAPLPDTVQGRRRPVTGTYEAGALVAYARVTQEVQKFVAPINEDLARYGIPRLAISAGIALWRPGLSKENLLVTADRAVGKAKDQNAEAVLAGLSPHQRAKAIEYMRWLVRHGLVDPRLVPLRDSMVTGK